MQRRNAGADGDGHYFRPAMQQGVRHLSEWIVVLGADLGLIIGGEAPVADVADDTDDADGIRSFLTRRERAVGPWKPKPLADGILGAEGVLRHDFVNNDDGLVSQAIVIVEETPAKERNAHDL